MNDLIQTLQEAGETLTMDSIGRAIVEAYGDKAYLVAEGINRHK